MHPESLRWTKVGKIQDFDESFYRTDVEMDFKLLGMLDWQDKHSVTYPTLFFFDVSRFLDKCLFFLTEFRWMNKKTRKFNLIIAGLDNIAARRWMNATLHDMVDRTSGEPDPSSLDAMMATRVIWREKPGW